MSRERQKVSDNWPAARREEVKPRLFVSRDGHERGSGERNPEIRHGRDGGNLQTSDILRRCKAPPPLSMTNFQPAEPPCADPHARWCGRGRAVRPPSIPIRSEPLISPDRRHPDLKVE